MSNPSGRDDAGPGWAVVVTGHGEVGMDTVDAIARLELAARRHGGGVQVRATGCDLSALVDLAGLARVVPVGDWLALEPCREPEAGEQVGVEEVVDVGDPPT